MKSIALKGNKRTDRGSSDAKSLRKEDKIPAVLYGGKDNTHFMIDEIPFGKIIHSPNVYFVDLNIDGTTVRSIIKEVQYHPVTDKVLHVDFLEIVAGKSVTVMLPIKIIINTKSDFQAFATNLIFYFMFLSFFKFLFYYY